MTLDAFAEYYSITSRYIKTNYGVMPDRRGRVVSMQAKRIAFIPRTIRPRDLREARYETT